MNARDALPIGVALLLGWFAARVEAGPSLPITKPPVNHAGLLTGPSLDPAATNGQWFTDYTSGAVSNRTHEFHDNLGGGAMGTHAITGYVSQVIYAAGPGTPILGFSVLATVWNDNTNGADYAGGTNSHGEWLSYQEPLYTGTLYAVKLVASFALADTNTIPAAWIMPYRDRPVYIEAINEDEAAWYCWSPEDQDPLHNPKGNYYVPTWDFGDIPPGQSATRQLDFTVVPPGLPPVGDARYAAIDTSFAKGTDVLLNRSTSLKISTWIDEITADSGLAYPLPEEGPYRSSDVSVFHNITNEEEVLLDFGDAPDSPYPTLLSNNGARHVMVAGVQMGSLIDAEADGQPNVTATGDDKANLADEDGVAFMTALIPGLTGVVQVTVSTAGYIHAWCDFNANGSWADGGENIINGQWVTNAGSHTFSVPVPAGSPVTNTFARFRFITQQTSLSYTGLAADGEVEDYEVAIQSGEDLLDYGDAPYNPPFALYPTWFTNNGARHVISVGARLGNWLDSEGDGQPTPSADGDDLNPPLSLDDEDGIALPPVMVAGAPAFIQVTASAAGFVNAWFDWNKNGTWADAGEYVVVNAAVTSGVNPFVILTPLPPATVAGGTYTRWRFTTYAPASPSYAGLELNGEVEDYEVQVEILDFGDAPDPFFPTVLANDGARHRVTSPAVYWLGVNPPDIDLDGMPAADASGDDGSNLDDEDGVLTVTVVRGSNLNLRVVASTNGYLNAWVDWNGNQNWADAGEQIASDLGLSAGTNTVPVTVPSGSIVGAVHGRFRFNSTGALGYTGLAADGEVEDHVLTIYQAGPDRQYFYVTNLVFGGGTNLVQWDGETNVTYEAQYTTNGLLDTNLAWTTYGSAVSGAPYQQSDTNLSGSPKVYRIIAPFAPPPP